MAKNTQKKKKTKKTAKKQQKKQAGTGRIAEDISCLVELHKLQGVLLKDLEKQVC